MSDGMTAEEYRTQATQIFFAALRFQPHQPQHASLLQRAQWYATMALVEQGREGRTP